MRIIKLAFLALLVLVPVAAFADAPFIAAPVDGAFGLQPGASPIRALIDVLYDELQIVITAISLFVLALLVWVLVRYNRHVNKVPSTVTHHVKLEIAWTLLPVVILAVIAVPSLTLLYYEDRTPNPEMTLKVTGHQWYWSYEYPDNGNIGYDSRPIWSSSTMKPEEVSSAIADAQPGWIVDGGAPRRLLEVDNRVVLPVDTNIRVLINGADVIHSWSLPAIGIKRDAVPGRLNEVWLRIDKEGLYYGQCSQICGAGHGYMPIVVEAVSKARYAQWVDAEHAKGLGQATPAVAVAPSADATDKTIHPLNGGDAKDAPQVDPSKDAKPDEAGALDKTPPANPNSPPVTPSGSSTGGSKL